MNQIAEDAALLERENITARQVALEARTQLAMERRSMLRVTEPRTYGPNSKHSWFLDLYRDQRGQTPEVRARLERHAKEAAKDAPALAEARRRRADLAYEAAFTGTVEEQRALSRFTGAGGLIFERRAMTRVDGAGGYLVPPAFLIDRAVPAARADAALLAAVTQLPLPELCDSVNIPRRLTGTGTGVQTTDTAPAPGRDLTDALVNAPVRTISGTQDASAQFYEQGSGGAGGHLDQLLWDDLHADEMVQLDGNLIMGSGQNGQALGLLPPQTTIGTSLAVYAPNGNTSASQTLFNPGGAFTALGTTIAQCISGVNQARGLYPTHLLSNGWVWAMAAANPDDQHRPMVQGHALWPQPPDSGMPSSGPLGLFPGTGLPFLADNNVATSYGGGVPNQPSLGATTGPQFAFLAGLGASALFTPVIPVVAADLVVFLGAPKMRLLREVLSGSLQYRFQLYRYVAVMVNRYQAVASGTLPNSGGWAVGACSSYGVATQFGSNSLLSRSGQGFGT